nr:hypothetical protein GCM10020185_68600 [Pseudomonas brassicacearum subsp. brassicacearum]
MDTALERHEQGITREADILIIGGGLSGAMLAAQLLRLPGRREVLIVEPRSELGRGEAYSAVELGHTLNGNAARMSVDPDNADDLTQWLTAFIEAGGWPEADQQHVPISELFPPRGMFGLYVQQRLAEAREIGAQNGSTAEHVRGEAVDLRVVDDAVMLTLDDGQLLRGRFAVLATGMFPAARTPQTESSGLNAAALDPWDVAAMRQLDQQSTVLIIGSGLTMVDAVVSLEQAGHRGPIEVFFPPWPAAPCAPPATRLGGFPRRRSQPAVTTPIDASPARAMPSGPGPRHRLAGAAGHGACSHRAFVEPGQRCTTSAVRPACTAVVGEPSSSFATAERRTGGASARRRAIADPCGVVQGIGVLCRGHAGYYHPPPGRDRADGGAGRGADQLQRHRI